MIAKQGRRRFMLVVANFSEYKNFPLSFVILFTIIFIAFFLLINNY